MTDPSLDSNYPLNRFYPQLRWLPTMTAYHCLSFLQLSVSPSPSCLLSYDITRLEPLNNITTKISGTFYLSKEINEFHILKDWLHSTACLRCEEHKNMKISFKWEDIILKTSFEIVWHGFNSFHFINLTRKRVVSFVVRL